MCESPGTRNTIGFGLVFPCLTPSHLVPWFTSAPVSTGLKAIKAGPELQADTIFLQGYEADNANILLLRLRSFTIGRPISDKEMLAPDAQDRIAALVGVMEPFVSPSQPILAHRPMIYPFPSLSSLARFPF